MKTRFVIVGLIIVVLLGGLAYFQLVFKPQMISEFMASQPQPAVTVNAEQAQRDEWIARIPSIGTLQSVQGVEITAEVAGVVQEISFSSGETVEKGAPLVQLDDDVEQADLKSNSAALRRAELAWERQQSLFDRGTSAQSTLDEARAARDEAAAAVERIRALIEQKSIEAPFAGRLGIRRVDIGQFVAAGTAMVSLQMLDPIYVDFTVPEQRADRVAAGAKVRVTVDTYPGEVFEGEVEAVNSRVEQDTRTLLVRAKLPNTDEKLLPGMFANVAVLVGEPQPVVTLPRTAVSYSLYGDTVYILKPVDGSGQSGDGSGDGDKRYQAQQQVVETGETRENRVAITKGVSEGDLVVTSGQLKLQPGATVTVAESGDLPRSAQSPQD